MALDPLEQIDLSDLPDYDADDEYRALLRALRRQQGFGLLFVRCSPEQGRKLIEKLQQDLPQKHCERLTLTESLPGGDFFGRAAEFLAEHSADVVFVEGLRHSLLEYEDIKRASGWSEAEILNYSWRDIPLILRNLNQQRDAFRNQLSTCFVFLVSPFLVKYLARRAPDFFDWRSGVFEFKDSREDITRSLETDRFEDYDRILQLMPEERRWQMIRIRDLLEQNNISSEQHSQLFFDLGRLQHAENAYEDAIASYDCAVDIQPDKHVAWNNRGNALFNLGRYEEAITSYDRAVDIKPDDHKA
ncbi:tetratricopeptide repeat protein, partial [Halomicronema sp. CCY15110]|uniref:tetratricopeptide repeat protein n=1 Tax=Halomicronema sp. CCY15110 TaxID=2767773 RepID=UPI001EF1E562